jgi:hypothetical protein
MTSAPQGHGLALVSRCCRKILTKRHPPQACGIRWTATVPYLRHGLGEHFHFLPKEDAMTPRNPEDSSKADVQNKVLPDVHDTFRGDTHAAPVSKPHSTPILDPRQEEGGNTKLALDRVEAYLKGPTVFSA